MADMIDRQVIERLRDIGVDLKKLLPRIRGSVEFHMSNHADFEPQIDIKMYDTTNVKGKRHE